MTKPDTWMPLYIGDYLADTTHLSVMEHGAYLLLIMTYWRRGPLPDDDKALANMAKCDRKIWLSEVGPVVRQFFSSEGGVLHHKRIDAELSEAAANSAKKRAAAGARWSAEKKQKVSSGDASGGAREDAPADAGADAHADADASDLHMHRTCPYAGGLPSPSPFQEDSVLRTGADAPLKGVRKKLFDEGVPIVERLTGMPPKPARSFLGKQLKAMSDDCAGTLAILLDAEEHAPADPAGWITATVQARSGQRPTGLVAKMAASRERLRNWHAPSPETDRAERVLIP